MPMLAVSMTPFDAAAPLHMSLSFFFVAAQACCILLLLLLSCCRATPCRFAPYVII